MRLNKPCRVQNLWLVCALVLASAVIVASGCAGPAPSEAQNPEQPVAAENTPARVNMEEIFPPGPGRDLVLNNCQSCHPWVPIVTLQMNEAAWQRNSLEHRERVPALSDEEFKLLYDYLSSTFTPDRPVPKLPEGLRETWTTY